MRPIERSRSAWRALGTIASLCLLTCMFGCVRGCPSSRPPIHLNPNMDYQPKYEPQDESAFFYDGAAMREPIPGTVARGRIPETGPRVTGKDESGAFLATAPMPVDEELESLGAIRYDVFCQPCHDARGNGKGILTERGAVPVPSFHEERLQQMPDGELFDVITNGKGLMQGYRYPIRVDDRWAIVSYVRKMQRDRAAVSD